MPAAPTSADVACSIPLVVDMPALEARFEAAGLIPILVGDRARVNEHYRKGYPLANPMQGRIGTVTAIHEGPTPDLDDLTYELQDDAGTFFQLYFCLTPLPPTTELSTIPSV